MNTWISRDKKGRSTYDPDWSPSLPWSVVFKGEVKSYRGSLKAAKMALREKYNCY